MPHQRRVRWPWQSKQRQWPNPTVDEIRKRARILVVDDTEFPYVELFKRDGYTLEKWSDITNLSDLEAGDFDLILLDLVGVGRSESKDEGLGILRYLRNRAPAQMIVAYSDASWPLENQPFFQMADATLQKSADYVDFKRTVDDLLVRRFSLGFYLDRIRREAGDQSIELPSLERLSREAILTGRTDRLQSWLGDHIPDVATVDRILQIANIAIGIANLWHK